MATALMYALYGLLAYVGLTAALMALSVRIPRAGFYGRLLSSYICLFACAAYGVVVSLVFGLVGRRGASQWAVARAFKLTMGLTTGVVFDVQGKEHLDTRPALFIGNHQTSVQRAFSLGPDR